VIPEADLSRLRTVPIARRPNKVAAGEFAHPPGTDRSFAAFLDALPDILVARDFRRVVAAVVHAARSGHGVVLMLGGHVVKTGLSPVIIELMRRRVVTHIAMNGSAAIHDYEVARSPLRLSPRHLIAPTANFRGHATGRAFPAWRLG
jgi:hypothetical protein